jgi:hypothetical protein
MPSAAACSLHPGGVFVALWISNSDSSYRHQHVAHPVHVAMKELEQPFEIDDRAGTLGLQAAQDRSDVTGLFGTMLGQLGDLAFDSGTQLVGVFELVRLLALTGGLE